MGVIHLKSNKKKNKNISIKEQMNIEVVNMLIIASCILVAISLHSDATGVIGKIIRTTILSCFGFYGYVLPYIIILTSIVYMSNKIKLEKKLIFILLINLSLVSLLHIIYFEGTELGFLNSLKISMQFGKSGVGGGILGYVLSYISIALFGKLGSYILIFLITSISLLVIADKSFFKILNNFIFKMKNVLKEKRTMSNSSKTKDNYEEKPKNNKSIITDNEKKEIIGNNLDLQIFDYTNENTTEDSSNTEDYNISLKDPSNNDQVASSKSNISQVDLKTYENYEFPSIDILKKREEKVNKDESKEVRKNADTLINTLLDFGIKAKVVKVSIGPSITQYEIQPAAGVKVSRIVSLSNDLALSLASSDLRIEAPIPGKSAIGIEVPNKDKVGVNLREIIQSSEFENIETKLPIALGKDISGKPIIANIEKMPHLLIAGATGSGKSVCINTIIASIIYKSRPDEVKLLMIDPKMVELSVYNGIPHLLIPVVTEAKKAANALNWAVSEMNQRYKKFSETGVRDMRGYNNKVKDISEKMPNIIIIIDELADLMMVSASEVEDYICRLAQMARAAGMHLIVATQRPSVDIITGTIKANIPSRISFAVSSQVDSRTILDSGGAEKLLGRGDMLFHPVGESKPIRLQGAFIDDDEVEEIVSFLKQDTNAEYEESIIAEIEKQEVILQDDDVDELFSKAVDLVLEEGQASISLLQRKLKVGYARAARIVDTMEDKGIVGGHEGSKPRKILITSYESE